VFLISFSSFSIFVITLLFVTFCFDFVSADKLYFFSQNILIIFFLFIFFVVFSSHDFLEAKKFLNYEYDLILHFIILSSVCLCFCNELLLIYIAIELQSLSFYVLATFNRNSEFSAEAGLKYFIFGGLMSCFLLFGIFLTYSIFGSLSLELLLSLINYSYDPIFFNGFLFILTVFIFKVGSFPFHF
jgi:NADH-quinone oxidoreductase subunit N